MTLIHFSEKIMQTIQIIPENSNCFRMNDNPYSDFDAKVYNEQKKFTQGVSLDEETVSFFPSYKINFFFQVWRNIAGGSTESEESLLYLFAFGNQ